MSDRTSKRTNLASSVNAWVVSAGATALTRLDTASWTNSISKISSWTRTASTQDALKITQRDPGIDLGTYSILTDSKLRYGKLNENADVGRDKINKTRKDKIW